MVLLLLMPVRLLFVLGILFILLRIAWWASAGKEMSPWLSTIAVLFYAISTVRVPFLFGVWGKMCNSIVLFPDHYLFINFY